jgi:threonine dehydratase
MDQASIAATETRIRAYVRHTPVIEVRAVDFGLAGEAVLCFKLELLQHTGSFKVRGAFANLLARRLPEAGVVAASGGNHGIAVAYAAKQLGVSAKIFVPTVSSPAKQQQIRSHGAELVVGGDRYADALEASERWVAASGALAIHAYDQPETMLGQGTVGLELQQQAPQLDTVLVAVGGGGLIGGMAAWYGSGSSKVRLIGVEPEAIPTLARALEAGQPVDVTVGGVAADSLGARRVGALMFPLAQQHIERVLLVPDEAIVEAQRALWRVLRVAAEPGGAAAFAALLSGAYRPQPAERVGILICGGNTGAVDFDR